MKSLLLSIVSSLLLLAGCSESNNKTKPDHDINIDDAIKQAEARRAADPSASGGNTCLLAYQQKYDALLPEEWVIRETGFDKQNMTTKYTKVMKPEHHSFTYKFTNKRRGKLRGLDREMELPDIVSVHSIKAMSPDQFTKSYRPVSDQEMQAAKDAAKDLTAGKTDEQKETIRKGSNTLLNTFKDISQGYEAVEGLGDNAAWNKVTYDLAVLQNGVKFEIKVDVSNDVEKNKAVAIQLAKALLTKCL